MPASTSHQAVRQRPRLAALACVAAAHLALLLALLSVRAWPDRAGALQPEPLWLRWIDDAATATARTDGPTPTARQRRPRAAASPPAPREAPQPLDATSAAIRPGAPPTATAAPDSPTAAADRPPARPALLWLDLPQASRAASAPRRNPALDDPRANTPRASFESRLNDAMGGVGERLVEERLADGTLRLRRGTDCVLVHPSRAAGIDPFNQSVMPKPRTVEKCP